MSGMPYVSSITDNELGDVGWVIGEEKRQKTKIVRKIKPIFWTYVVGRTLDDFRCKSKISRTITLIEKYIYTYLKSYSRQRGCSRKIHLMHEAENERNSYKCFENKFTRDYWNVQFFQSIFHTFLYHSSPPSHFIAPYFYQ